MKSQQLKPSSSTTQLIKFIRRFRENEGGAITVATLLLLVAMLMVGRMAVDFIRSEANRIYINS